MIILYTFFCFFCFFVGKFFYKNFYNPICLYTLVWLVAVIIHESGLVVFYDLTRFCWTVIFASHLFFVCGCIIGARFSFKEFENFHEEIENEQLLKKYIMQGIVVTMTLSGIAIIANLKTMVSVYGFNLLSNVVHIYADRVYELQTIERIPYLGSFMFITLPLLGCYLKRFGFHLIVVPCVFFVCANSLISGGRAGIIFSLLLFLSGYFCMRGSYVPNLKGRRLFLILSVVAFISMIVFISQERSVGVTLTYATDKYIDIFGYDITIYKGLVYIGGPIGTLNEYLKDCDFFFGKNTFLTIYNIAAKFGLCDKIPQYQEYYLTPISCNVGSWVREIIEDFSLFGAVFFIPFFGFLSSFFYCSAKRNNSIAYKIIWAVFSVVIVLSFFDWKFRASNMWIAVMFGFLIGYYIDCKSIILEKSKEPNDG